MTREVVMAVWPAERRLTEEKRETPYRLLAHKAGWLARAAWRFLQWRKALEPYVESVQKWSYVPAADKPLINLVLDCIREGRRHDLAHIAEGKAVIIVGEATFQEFTGSPMFRDTLRFTASITGNYYGREIAGVPVHVVPGMSGVAIVPRVLIETKG